MVGAYKAGTTTLDHLLRAHPQVFMPSRKEPNHWAFAGGANTDHPAAAYCVASPTDYRALFAGARGDQRVGEVSPAYLALPGTAERLHGAAPETRIVAVLRDPVERAYSDYLMYVRDGREDAPDFRTALDRQAATARGGPTHRLLRRDRLLRPPARAVGRPVRRGTRCTCCCSRTWPATRAARSPRCATTSGVDRVLPKVAGDALNVSGVPRNAAVALAHRLRHKHASKFYRLPRRLREVIDAALVAGLDRPAMDDADRRRLTAVYRDDVAALERLLDMPLDAWRSFATGAR